VDDVFGHVVFATRNEDLGASDLVRSVGLWDGLSGHLGQVRPTLRLGQAHGARPLTRHQLRHVPGMAQ
jgi:hypothetical protein